MAIHKGDRLAELTTSEVLMHVSSDGGSTWHSAQSDAFGRLKILEGFSIPEYNEIELFYTGDNLTKVIYKLNNDIVATLTLEYSEDKLVSVTKT